MNVCLRLASLRLAINAISASVGKHMLYVALLDTNTITQFCS